MSLQSDWTGIILFFVPPVTYLLTAESWNKDDAAFYRYLSANSSVFFLQGRAQAIFGIVWTAFFGVLMPLSGYFFWKDTTDMLAHPATYSVGLSFYWFGLVLLLGWFRIFFRMRAVKTAFFYTLLADACVLGFLVCCVLFGHVFGIVSFSLLTAWLAIATMWTAVAAFVVPPLAEREDKKNDDATAAAETMGKVLVASAIPVNVWHA